MFNWFKKKSSALPESIISKLKLEDGDVIVVHLLRDLSPAELKDFVNGWTKRLKDTFKNSDVLFIPNGVNLSIISKGSPKYNLIIGNKKKP